MLAKGQNTSRTKRMNKSLVLQTLLRYGPIPRQRIAEMTHLTRATITYITSQLIEEGVVQETGALITEKNSAGRRSVGLDLKSDAVWVIGIHISMFELKIGLVNLKGEVEDLYEKKAEPCFNQDEYVHFIITEINEYLSAHSHRNPSGIGISSTGIVDYMAGRIFGNEETGWPDIDLLSNLRKEFDLPVFLDNYVSSMALSEKMFGLSRTMMDFMYIYIGQGVGGGLILNDDLYRSGVTGAGEFGHMTYMPGGRKCWCGNEGCLEQYVSELILLEELGAGSIEEVIGRVHEGDNGAVKVLEEAGEKISIVLSSLVNMIHVQKIVVGGMLADQNLPIVEKISEGVNNKSFLAKKQPIEVAHSIFGRDIEVAGAGALALWNEFYSKIVE
ncbi:ROK family protein [Bacillus mangrovi]|uniref:ROK family protein n=1 Tax=Metabacillus mangrovi TaxID=1491830 RepID=A0A7X2S6F5_9BACI|nr:ROK family transcriptional regulator [Metabacillus mangrovi]MTH54277.1 ROK family protein [Metabacillus mangrovi]